MGVTSEVTIRCNLSANSLHSAHNVPRALGVGVFCSCFQVFKLHKSHLCVPCSAYKTGDGWMAAGWVHILQSNRTCLICCMSRFKPQVFPAFASSRQGEDRGHMAQWMDEPSTKLPMFLLPSLHATHSTGMPSALGPHTFSGHFLASGSLCMDGL